MLQSQHYFILLLLSQEMTIDQYPYSCHVLLLLSISEYCFCRYLDYAVELDCPLPLCLVRLPTATCLLDTWLCIVCAFPWLHFSSSLWFSWLEFVPQEIRDLQFKMGLHLSDVSLNAFAKSCFDTISLNPDCFTVKVSSCHCIYRWNVVLVPMCCSVCWCIHVLRDSVINITWIICNVSPITITIMYIKKTKVIIKCKNDVDM